MNPSDPNLDPQDLLRSAEKYPKEVLSNVALELISLEDPAMYDKIVDLCYRVIVEDTATIENSKSFYCYEGDGSYGNGRGGGIGYYYVDGSGEGPGNNYGGTIYSTSKRCGEGYGGGDKGIYSQGGGCGDGDYHGNGEG